MIKKSFIVLPFVLLMLALTPVLLGCKTCQNTKACGASECKKPVCIKDSPACSVDNRNLSDMYFQPGTTVYIECVEPRIHTLPTTPAINSSYSYIQK